MKYQLKVCLVAALQIALAGCQDPPEFIGEIPIGKTIGTVDYQLTLVPLEEVTSWNRYQSKKNPGSVILVTGLSYDAQDNHYSTYAIRTETRKLSGSVVDAKSAISFAEKKYSWRNAPNLIANRSGELCVGDPRNEYAEEESGIVYSYQAFCANFKKRLWIEIYASGIKSHAGAGSEFSSFTGRLFETYKAL